MSEKFLSKDVSAKIQKYLLQHGGFYIGSKGLGVGTESSDADIVVSRKLYEHVKDSLFSYAYTRQVSIKKYFKVLPLGNSELVKMGDSSINGAIDIIILDDPNDFEAMKRALSNVKNDYSVNDLQDKNFRIRVFENALRAEGFKYGESFMQLIHKPDDYEFCR